SDLSDGENGVSGMEKEDDEKKYYCQRCLNHDLHFPRKGHKTECSYANCPCPACAMVEQRRQLNNMISRKKVVHFPDPKCARCYAHGIFSRLRGHKKNQCIFQHCNCEPCQLVGTRRDLMARQIRLRRSQKKMYADGGKKGGKKETSPPSMLTPSQSPLLTPLRPIAVAPSSSMESLSPSLSPLSPSHSSLSSSSLHSVDPSPASPVSQLFHFLPHINPSFITLSLPFPSVNLLPPPPPPPLQPITPEFLHYLLL
ncbi:hypothetical protein PMAYCL1PPCAC_06950, partial [Pristionchus mayeri]